SVMGSKGAGANMRVAPVGLIRGLDADTLAGAAQMQAGLTHGHPTALAAAELTAVAVRLLGDGLPPADTPAALREHAAAQRTRYHQAWLGDLWQRSGAPTPGHYI